MFQGTIAAVVKSGSMFVNVEKLVEVLGDPVVNANMYCKLRTLLADKQIYSTDLR